MGRVTLSRLKLSFMFLGFSAVCFFVFAAIVYRQAAVKLYGDNANVDDGNLKIDVVVPFVRANNVLISKFRVLISSMLAHLSGDIKVLRLHIIGDEKSIQAANNMTYETVVELNHSATAIVKVVPHSVDEFASMTNSILDSAFKHHFIYKPGSYYSDTLFFFSIVLHRLLPTNIGRVIVLDVDLRFNSDINRLHSHFDQFNDLQLIGIAHEQQPVYRHIFHTYRKLHPKTSVGGDLSSNGFPGFNSGVLLLHLDRIRASRLYARLLRADVIDDLALKYKFQGHLGDQDYFTLIGIDNRELFYVLDCTWNRQLCVWWRDLGYQNVFESYHECKGGENILHGNCNTFIPKK